MDVTDFKTFAHGFVKFLKTIGLSSLTFTEDVALHEIETLIETIGSVYPDGADSDFWKGFAAERELAGIFFDKQIYEIRATQNQLAAMESSGISEDTPDAEDKAAAEYLPAEEAIPEENFGEFVSEFQTRIVQLF